MISEIVYDCDHTSLQGLLPLDLGHRILNIHRLSPFSLCQFCNSLDNFYTVSRPFLNSFMN